MDVGFMMTHSWCEFYNTISRQVGNAMLSTTHKIKNSTINIAHMYKEIKDQEILNIYLFEKRV